LFEKAVKSLESQVQSLKGGDTQIGVRPGPAEGPCQTSSPQWNEYNRLIQLCGGLQDREMQEQVLDNMELERERGITIKAQSVTLYYDAGTGSATS